MMNADKKLWECIASGMSKAGFSIVLRLHPNTPKNRISDVFMRKYENYDKQWHIDHNGYHVLFVKERDIRGPEDNAYREPIIERLDNQTSKGISKYDTLLHENPLPMPHRLEHLAEELTDGLQYIEHIKAGHKKLVKEVIDALVDLTIMGGKMSNDDGRKILSIAKNLNNVVRELAGDGNKDQ